MHWIVQLEHVLTAGLWEKGPHQHFPKPEYWSTGVASIREGSECLYKAPASSGVVGQLSPPAEEELH